jgi:hypothetical protein
MASVVGYCNEFSGAPTGAKVEIMGEADWKGEPAYRVKTAWPDGSYRLDIISKERSLPLRREIPGVWTEICEDYQKIDGIAVPMRLTFQGPDLSEQRIAVTAAHAISNYPQWAFYPTNWKKVVASP